jgi:adenosylmethionine-8-amino-7-oxononanoate aminotransferase
MSRIFHRSLLADYPIAVGGKGMMIRLADGREIIDGVGGAAVSCLGHGNERVEAAIARQMGRIAYAHTSHFSSEPAEELAELLVGHQPGGLSHVWFVDSGSEGVEASIKLARQYFLEIGQPERDQFIARRQGYHGSTLGALSASGNMMRRQPYKAILSGAFHHVSPCFPYRFKRDDESEAEYCRRLADELEAEFQRLGPDRVAAFFAEPVVGATSGCVPAVGGYFRAVREICDRHGALLILDEVMCGMGRTGTTHAWEQEGITPDIEVIAKGLGGGYQPIGGILIAGRIVEAFRRGSGVFVHGHTYQGHPLACAAALAVQQVIRDDNLLANVRAMGTRLGNALTERFGNHPHVGDVRGRGLFRAIELVADRASKQVFDPALKVNARVKPAGLARGVSVYPMGGTIDGKHGDHVIVAPAYIAEARDIDAIVERLGAAVDDVMAGLPRQ